MSYEVSQRGFPIHTKIEYDNPMTINDHFKNLKEKTNSSSHMVLL